MSKRRWFAAAALAALTMALAAQVGAEDSERKILLVGDSMAWSLGLEMQPLVEAGGDEFRFRHKTSDSIRAFAANNRLKEDLIKYKPDVVLISLGSNEGLIPKPESLAAPIKKIVAQVGDTPCYWIGPPMWTPDTGVVRVLEENAAPCRFFNSTPLKLDRRHDGYHPSREGSKRWAEAILAWIKANPPSEPAP